MYIGLGDETGNRFNDFFIGNKASWYKMIIGHTADARTTGAGAAPFRGEVVGKWLNTSDQITKISCTQTSTGDFLSGSFIRVWGHD